MRVTRQRRESHTPRSAVKVGRGDSFYPLTSTAMTRLYHVRLQYGFHVDASDKAEAFAKACRAIRENPGSHIARIEQPDAPKGKRSFVKRLVTGE